jgi:hypothetical protein
MNPTPPPSASGCAITSLLSYHMAAETQLRTVIPVLEINDAEDQLSHYGRAYRCSGICGVC